MILILEFQQTVWMFDCVSSSGWPATAEGRGGECWTAVVEGGRVGWWRPRRVVEAEAKGGGGGGQQRVAEAEGAEYDVVSSLYPHCIPSKRGRRRWVAAATVEGGGWWAVVAGGWCCILTVSSLYPHCILTVSSLYPSKERCLLSPASVKGGGWWVVTVGGRG